MSKDTKQNTVTDCSNHDHNYHANDLSTKGKKRNAEPIRETKRPNDNKNTDQAQIKTPSSASAASSNQDYCARTQSTQSTTV
jgi:hypothetical protein